MSLSNPMAINRGAADHAQAVSILREYPRRGAEGRAFAEWFSIDPPFPDGIFGDERLVQGAYVNGGIMPLVGGELARAAFEHGFEAYGVGHPGALLRVDRAGRARPTSGTFRTAGRAASKPARAPRRSRPTAGGRARWRGRLSRDSPASSIAGGRSTRCACRRAGKPPASRAPTCRSDYAASGASVNTATGAARIASRWTSRRPARRCSGTCCSRQVTAR
ncbi:MAG: hypothetical protein MZV64_43140 [Ignavibacteriales bacterium]|nr:hypothetical protein [Ignavibacteriales bacterium]